ncbi:hypothetical protein D187_005257 [Cystobacter fuscus DSM 2262]|uniref:Uncharacterized protein n=1 Tax=Cystobacter fuscus (strain ATCC 25194 / DSM 2262 / NBRC 100088 / M29) TaxID=1242864 RepID=S9R5B1_CYSF2|nr:hypothetical protein D187_005257 [Cystobacter fuscus DSM 2262]
MTAIVGWPGLRCRALTTVEGTQQARYRERATSRQAGAHQ